MTAASGIVHEEKHSRKFTQRGGTLEMAQLWVNLPAKDKMSSPHYQTLLNQDIPAMDIGGGKVRVIAGEFQGIKGPARTFTSMNVWDVRLKAGSVARFPLPGGFNTALIVLQGRVLVNGTEQASRAELVVFEQPGEQIAIEAQEDSTLLLLSGQPIDDPVADYGPFVMNTPEELRQAFADYRDGRMGTLGPRIQPAPPTGS